MFQDDGDAIFLGVRQHFLPGIDTPLSGFLVIHAVKAHSREGDYVFTADILGQVHRPG